MKKNHMFNLSIFVLVLALLCSTMTPALAASGDSNVNPAYAAAAYGNADESPANDSMTLPSGDSSNPMPNDSMTLPDSATGGDIIDDSSANIPSDSNSSGSENAPSSDNGSDDKPAATSSSGVPCDEPGPGHGDDNRTVPAHKDVFHGLDTVDTTDPFFHWTELLLDETPTLVHNTTTGAYYLKYRLNTASKIVTLYLDHQEAFEIGWQLSLLDEMNDMQHTIWTKFDWRKAEATGSLLSQATIDAMNELHNLDAETVLNFIKTRPEYATSDALHMWVGYDLASISYHQSKVADGLKDILTSLRDTSAGKDIPTSLVDFLLLENPTAAQVSAAAHELLEAYPVAKNLIRFNDLRRTMPASRTLCIQNLDADTLDELYNDIQKAAGVFWPIDLYQVERMSYSVQIPDELVNILPIEEIPAPAPKPVPDFPITATGGECFVSEPAPDPIPDYPIADDIESVSGLPLVTAIDE